MVALDFNQQGGGSRMRKVLVWVAVLTLVVGSGVFASVFGDWKTITLNREDLGLSVSYSVPASSFEILEDEEFGALEEEIGGFVQVWVTGSYWGTDPIEDWEDDAEMLIVLMFTEFAEFVYMMIQFGAAEELEDMDAGSISVGNVEAQYLMGIDDYDNDFQFMAFVPGLAETEMGSLGMIAMIFVSEDLVQHGPDLSMRFLNSLRF